MAWLSVPCGECTCSDLKESFLCCATYYKNKLSSNIVWVCDLTKYPWLVNSRYKPEITSNPSAPYPQERVDRVLIWPMVSLKPLSANYNVKCPRVYIKKKISGLQANCLTSSGPEDDPLILPLRHARQERQVINSSYGQDQHVTLMQHKINKNMAIACYVCATTPSADC